MRIELIIACLFFILFFIWLVCYICYQSGYSKGWSVGFRAAGGQNPPKKLYMMDLEE